jgi:methylenetetrahydrofolate reductase (NADPH)
LDEELNHLKAKIDAGADFIITQLFYDVEQFVGWQSKVRAKGILQSQQSGRTD